MSNTTAKYYLQKAFDLAEAIDPHQTSPNPRVGCVIVADGKMVSMGVHEKHGEGHAEAQALSGELSLEKADVYITLEPCDHFHGKKTPSCTDRLIAQRPQKIYVDQIDPHFQGKNIEKIRQSGIPVEVCNFGFHERLNPFFATHIATKAPFVTLKIAQSLDGKITAKTKYLTHEKSLHRVHEMRAQYQAILTTTKTVLADNPRFDTRLPKGSNADLIILGDSELPKSLQIWSVPQRTIYRFLTFEAFRQSSLFSQLDSIMTECGTQMNTYLLKNNLVSAINFFIAPMIVGDLGLPNIETSVPLDSFYLKAYEKLDSDVFMDFRKV